MVRTIVAWSQISVLVMLGLAATAPESTLIAVIKQGDHAALRALLLKRPDVNAPEADGTTALHWAAYRDDLEAADLLIKAGANPNTVNRYGVAAIFLACNNGSAPMIERLLTAGVDANATLPEGETALMTAARSGNAKAVLALLARGARVDAAEKWRGQDALMWAAAEGHTHVVDVLVRAGADVHRRSQGAPAPGQPQAPGPLPPTPYTVTGAAAPPPPAPKAESPTAESDQPRRPRAVTRLTFTPLLFAVRAGHIETTKALLDAGANVNDAVADGTSALVLAIVNAHFELASVLLERGADPNADVQGWTALHQLVWTRRPNFGRPPPPPTPTGTLDSLELARMLLAKGANPNALQRREPRDNNRNDLNRIEATPFLLAAKSADVDLMRLLVKHGADPLRANVDGTTPLMVAAGVGLYKLGESPGTNEEALEAVKLALELGGDVNAVDKLGNTVLHGAALRGANAIVEFLVEKGIKLEYITAKNDREWSPLGIADGIFHISVFIAQPETAALLRKLQKDGAWKEPKGIRR